MTIPSKKPKPTDAERYRRFLDMAEKVGASDRAEDFDLAFEKVVKPKTKGSTIRKRESDQGTRFS